MDDIFIYCIPLPDNVSEAVTPCLTGYTVYINSKLDREHALQAYRHALRHIRNGDFERPDVQVIEEDAH